MFTSTDYHLAYNYAVVEARQLNRPVGIERVKFYGRDTYVVKLIPVDPAKRFGWELRCEIVNPTDPLTERSVDAALLPDLTPPTNGRHIEPPAVKPKRCRP